MRYRHITGRCPKKEEREPQFAKYLDLSGLTNLVEKIKSVIQKTGDEVLAKAKTDLGSDISAAKSVADDASGFIEAHFKASTDGLDAFSSSSGYKARYCSKCASSS